MRPLKASRINNLRVLNPNVGLRQISDQKWLIEDFLQSLPSEGTKLTVFINKRKIKMQKIYYNLIKELKLHVSVEFRSVDSIYPGFVTNHRSSNFTEPKAALVILTKKHYDKQRGIIAELTRAKIPTLVISLNNTYYDKDAQIFLVSDTRGLYNFLYLLANKRRQLTYTQFSEDYVITTEKLDFETLR